VDVRLKVCGITEPAEIDVLARESVDFAGLWYGVPGGPSDLPLEQWRQFAAATADAPGLNGVLVTFLKDPDALGEALEGSPVSWVQLHGYQTPGLVRAVKRLGAGVKVIKVLHVRGSDCIERRLIGAYEKAGVDVFLFDAVTADGRVGSTGQTLDAEFVATLAGELSRPFLLAGGISAENRDEHAVLAEHPSFFGIDVDTNARGADGKIGSDQVSAISRAWKGAPAGGEQLV
jgi:phosphoribosylanthranilate isomerase